MIGAHIHGHVMIAKVFVGDSMGTASECAGVTPFSPTPTVVLLESRPRHTPITTFEG
jgi:hypothetical protein